jgi:hypothetical protein
MNDSERRVSSGAAWAEFCDALKQAGEQIQRPKRRPTHSPAPRVTAT